MLDDPDIVSHLAHDGERLAYRALAATSANSAGLFFLHGFRSDMGGAKADCVAAYAREKGLACTRFDCRGHGQSSGDPAAGDIGQYRSDALAVFDQITSGPQILVGSSMGGWLALLLALARPTRVAGIVGIAAAPDFTEDLMWARLTPAQQATLLAEGRLAIPTAYADQPYIITRRLIESGRAHLLLRGPIAITCPVRLLHGMQDSDVPWQRATLLAECLASTDVAITLIKDGEHRLSRDSDLSSLRRLITAILNIP